MSFRWDRWFSGLGVAIVSGLIAAGVPTFFSDGVITGKEGVMIGGFCLAIFGSYLAQHPPLADDSSAPPAPPKIQSGKIEFKL